MKKMKLKWIILPAIFLSLAMGAAAAFYANVDIPVSGVSFGDGTSTVFTIKAGSIASTGWNFSGGNFSVTNPQGFSVTAPAIAKTFLISSSSLEACVVNTAPGTTMASVATFSGTFYIAPSSVATCVPVPGNLSATLVSTSTVTLNGNISSVGATTSSQWGFVWATSTNTPDIDNCLGSTSAAGSFGGGVFSLPVSSLLPSTTYYYRTFAVNRFGVAYASYGAFTTAVETSTPVLGVVSFTFIGQNSASSTSLISATGGANATQRGFVWGTIANPTVDTCLGSTSQSGSYGVSSFSLSLGGLIAETLYHVRSFALNSAGVAYGADNSFTTASTPTCSTLTGAATYNAYPTCGAASCSSGYSLSGSGASATCASSGGSGGGGGSSGGSAIITPNPNTDSSLVVSPAQGGNITKVFTDNNSVGLIVPQNSVSSQTTFSVAESTLTSGNIPTSSSEVLLVGGQAFSISAVNSSGQGVSSFSQPLTITIKIANLPATTTDLGVYYFDEKTKNWVSVPGAVFNSTNKTVTFTSNHLTLFAIFKMIGIKPIFADTIKIDPVVLITPVITEAENIVNRYYPLIDVNLEKQFLTKATSLKGFNTLSNTERDAIVKFSTYGTPSTKILGSGERLGVVNSYLSAFGKLPKTVADFNDVIKISTGRWPTGTSPEAIAKAKVAFKKIYLRDADMNKPNDNAAVTITAYGLRSAKRNMNSEKAAINIYKGIFKKAPTAATDWDTVRTIAYSGAKR